MEIDDSIALEENAKRKNQFDSMVEESKQEERMNKKRNLDEVDEVYDRDAEIYNLEQADWSIDKASDQRMVYVPKDTVIEFMKKIEDESNQRIKKYADYAGRMKLKFADYEVQSEEYYRSMLERFKTQARNTVNKKQRELDALTRAKTNHEERIIRLKERVNERSIKNFWSDESEESEDEPATNFLTRDVNMEEFNYFKAERKRCKLIVGKWIKQWRDDHNGENPTEENSQAIAMELADYNHANNQYLEVKMALLKQNKLPFMPEDFYNADRTTRQGTQVGKKTAFQIAQDAMLSTLGQGFGAAAKNNQNKSFNETMSPKGSNKVNFFEIRCKELQEEIDELHRLINENHGHDSILASYIDQVQRKDKLLLERDTKLDDLQTKNGLADKERAVLQAQLGMASNSPIPGVGADLSSGDQAEMARITAQNVALKEQVEALNHVQAKLVAKNKRYRDMHKSGLESQIGVFAPGILPEEEKQMGLTADAAGTRNPAGLGVKNSQASIGLESAVSIPDEKTIQEQLKELAESEEEDVFHVEKIEKAHVTRLTAEKDDNQKLKRQVTQLQGAVRRATLKNPNDVSSMVASIVAGQSGESLAGRPDTAESGLRDEPDTARIQNASAEELRIMIKDFQNNSKVKDSQLVEQHNEMQKIQDDYSEQLNQVRDDFAKLSEISVKEQERLEEKCHELEEELEAAKGAKAAGAVLDQKKKIDAIQAESEAKLKKQNVQLEKLKKQLEDMHAKDEGQVAEITELKELVTGLQRENRDLQKKAEKFSEAAHETVTLKEKLTLVKQQLKECTAEFDQVSTKYKEEQTKRKKLLNELEDMKGKVRVYCRIRPFSKRELDDPEKSQKCYMKTDEMSLTVGGFGGRGRPKDYNFDAVFDQDSTQDEIFEDCDRLIQSAVDGYNVCIFAYGQTGSGKTFTIQGNEDNPGLTPRAIVKMFDIIREMSNFRVKLKCYMVELYLSNLRDLLLPPHEEIKELEIKEQAGKVVVQGATEVEIVSVAQCEEIFVDGLSRRKTRATQMNSESSRSHLIFSIVIDTANINTGVRNVGKLTFVDLAGSEKSSKTGVDKQGQEEANAINMSLTALGNVIQALSEGAKFIPYRNHVLTKLMKDSLGGTAKTLMFVNCSPSVYNESEMKNSLDYASRVKKIKNTVAKNTETKETLKLKKCISDFEMQMDQMKELLMNSDQSDAWRALEAKFIDQYEGQGH